MTKVHILLIVLGSAVVAAVAVVGIVLAGGHHAGGNRSPVGTRAASAQAAGAQKAGGRPTGSGWLSHTQLLGRVNSDSAQVSAAERGDHGSAARAAGRRLAADAGAALSGPMPPVDAAGYRLALEQLRAAGADAAGGRFGPGSSQLLLAGQQGLMRVIAEVDMPVAAQAPAMPAGQSG
ncbi:MAG: hypothetical protein J2P28_16215 [Actinobacteria bacterium]|nr:hypothetical protein [Actinomycetota bacterium]